MYYKINTIFTFLYNYICICLLHLMYNSYKTLEIKHKLYLSTWSVLLLVSELETRKQVLQNKQLFNITMF